MTLSKKHFKSECHNHKTFFKTVFKENDSCLQNMPLMSEAQVGLVFEVNLKRHEITSLKRITNGFQYTNAEYPDNVFEVELIDNDHWTGRCIKRP